MTTRLKRLPLFEKSKPLDIFVGSLAYDPKN